MTLPLPPRRDICLQRLLDCLFCQVIYQAFSEKEGLFQDVKTVLDQPIDPCFLFKICQDECNFLFSIDHEQNPRATVETLLKEAGLSAGEFNLMGKGGKIGEPIEAVNKKQSEEISIHEVYMHWLNNRISKSIRYKIPV